MLKKITVVGVFLLSTLFACCGCQTGTCNVLQQQNYNETQPIYNEGYVSNYQNDFINYLNITSLDQLYDIYFKIEDIGKQTYDEYEKIKKEWIRSKNTEKYYIETKKFLLKTINLTIKRQKLMNEILYGKSEKSYNQTYNKTNNSNSSQYYPSNYSEPQYLTEQSYYNEYYNEPTNYFLEEENTLEYLRQAYEYVSNSTSLEEIIKIYPELKELIDQVNQKFSLFSYTILIEIYKEVANRYNLSEISKQLDKIMIDINTGKIDDIYDVYKKLVQIRIEIIKRGIMNEQ